VRYGVWRSLVARFVRDEEVAGSNPVTPTVKCLVRVTFGSRLAPSSCRYSSKVQQGRTLYAWLNDGTQWRQVGSFDPAYDENGTCPGYGAEPFDINLDNGRQYLVVLVDTGAIGCGGNDPKTAACQKQSFTATGRTGGSTVRLSIPHTG
jgi:hypothetical protein